MGRELIFKKCNTCDGTGSVSLSERITYFCPSCRGYGQHPIFVQDAGATGVEDNTMEESGMEFMKATDHLMRQEDGIYREVWSKSGGDHIFLWGAMLCFCDGVTGEIHTYNLTKEDWEAKDWNIYERDHTIASETSMRLKSVSHDDGPILDYQSKSNDPGMSFTLAMDTVTSETERDMQYIGMRRRRWTKGLFVEWCDRFGFDETPKLSYFDPIGVTHYLYNMSMFDVYASDWELVKRRYPLGYIAYKAYCGDDPVCWGDLSEVERQKWYAVEEAMMGELGLT